VNCAQGCSAPLDGLVFRLDARDTQVFPNVLMAQKTMIDLRSDTVTKPTSAMLEAMFSAEVGDDVFNEDPTVIRLEEKAASIFGMEAAIFCPSGTMTNQIAVKMHTQTGDEVICHRLSHLYNYEGGGIMVNSGASVRLLEGDRGRFLSSSVTENINVDDVHFPSSRLVCVENTCNKGGGSVWAFERLQEISAVTKERGLRFHLDGARLFNALANNGESPAKYGAIFDSISVCLSKGLGAPVGSLLLSTMENVKRARRIRKVLGGGMRQAGYLAAAGIYALDHHVERLAEDHVRAKSLGRVLESNSRVERLLPVDTNIVVAELVEGVDQGEFLRALKAKGVNAVPFGPQTIRMVTHLDFGDDDLAQVERIMGSM